MTQILRSRVGGEPDANRTTRRCPARGTTHAYKERKLSGDYFGLQKARLSKMGRVFSLYPRWLRRRACSRGGVEECCLVEVIRKSKKNQLEAFDKIKSLW